MIKYNRDVDKGADSEFGRKSLASGIGKLVKVEKGPFYIFPSSSVLFGTYCGIRINQKAQVVDSLIRSSRVFTLLGKQPAASMGPTT